MHEFAGYDTTDLLYESERSRVFRATRTSDGRRVVLKLSRASGEAAEAVARSEFELGAEADDEAAPLYLAVERDEAQVAIVMHDFGDDSLDRSIPREGMALGEFLPLATRIADRLAALHRAGVVHLDVKPANVLVAPGFGAVRLCDFDLSRRLDAAAEPLVQSGLAGTLSYISPEQTGRMDRPVDHRSDLYSLGVTFYEMLAGQRPFTGDAVELVYAHLALAPPPLRPDVPAPVAAIVRKLLAKDPDARYRSARGVALDLARARDAFIATGAVDDFEPGLRDVSPRLLVPETFHGRGREVDALLAAFEAAAGGASRMVLVRGWPGVGKSALVQRLRQPVLARRGLFASGKFDLLHRDVPYAALVGAVRGLIRGILAEPESVVAAWRTRIAGALGQSGQVMIDVIPELALVVGAQPKAVEVGVVEARGRFHWLSLAFIAALASPTSPLVLFLDDLQWADDASLRLIEALLTEVDARHLLIVGAYRDNKGEALHGLSLTRAAIEKVKPIEELALAPLGADEVDAMIADTLGRPVDEVRDLGALVTRKTRGNPFFVRQLLTAVHREGLLAFDEVRARWTWDVARIEAMGFDDDVVEFMVQEIRKLGEKAQRALSLGACIGSRFAPRTLAIVAGLDVDEALAQLAEARTRGLLVLDAAVGAAAREDVTLRFLHDRVQHAAYSLTPEADRARLHLTMGRLLVRDLDARQREERLFEVVRHLNEGATLITDADERLRLAAMNREAARRAQASNAYGAARTYLRVAFELLGARPWEEHPALALALRSAQAEAAFLDDDFDAMTAHRTEVLAHAPDLLARVPMHHLEALSLVARHQVPESLARSVAVLRELGVALPERPGKPGIVLALLRTMWRMRGRDRESLLALPRMTDARALAAMKVLAGSISPSFMAAPDLFPHICFAMLRLTLEHGNAPQSIEAYAAYAAILASALGDLEGAERMRDVAVGLIEPLGAVQQRAKVLYSEALFIQHRRGPLRESIPLYHETFRSALDCGDGEYADHGIVTVYFMELIAGIPVPDIHAGLTAHVEDVARLRRANVFPIIRQTLANLMGEAPDAARFHGPYYDEREETHEGRTPDHVSLEALCQGLLAYLLGDAERALDRFVVVEGLQETLLGSAHEPALRFFAALARLKVKGLAARASVRSAMRALRKWASTAPMNHAHRVCLLEAELAGLEGRAAEAMRAYAKSAALAREHGYVHEEALAHELAGAWHRGVGNELEARARLQEARQSWAAWGAPPVLRRFDEAWGTLLAAGPRRALPASTERSRRSALPPSMRESSVRDPSVREASYGRSASASDASSGASNAIDRATLFKSSRAMAEEIVLDALVGKLATMLIENAGAERGFLILADEGELRVEAEARGGGAEVVSQRGAALDDALGLSTAIVHFVARTRETLVLRDAAAEGMFTDDPSIARRKARSVLCAPLVERGKLVALVYMENNLAAGAFTQDRVEVISLLSAQAALSIHNARLYDDLQRALLEQRRVAEAQARFVPREFLEGLSRRTIVDVTLGEHVRREMSILFSDIKGFTTLVEGMAPGDHIAFINEYLSFMEPALLAHGGFVDSYIGDAIMALFQGGADDAVRAAVAMRAGLDRLNAARALRGAASVHMGVGVNTGVITMGTIGGPQHIKCGVIGDPVNLAARVESLTRRWGSFLLVSNHTRERLRDPEPYAFREVGRVIVVGRTVPVTLYESLAAETAATRDARLATLPRYTEGLAAFYGRRFGEAAACFDDCVRAVPDDRPASFLRERARRLERDGAPDDWTGVEALEKK